MKRKRKLISSRDCCAADGVFLSRYCFVSDALDDRLARLHHLFAVPPMPTDCARSRPVAAQFYAAPTPRTATCGPPERQAGVQHSGSAHCALMWPAEADLCAALLPRQAALFD